MPAFVARQPIFNHRLDVVGYELLFRPGGSVNGAAVDDAERATATILLNALTELDLERIVGAKPAWVAVSREFVLGGLVRAVPPALVGLEIDAADLDVDLITAMGELSRGGYRFALRGVGIAPIPQPVLALVEIIKLNSPLLGVEGMRGQCNRLRKFGGQILADHLGSRADHAAAAAAGCHLFQGSFYCQPAVVGTRGIAANRLALLQVVAALNAPEAELSDVESIIARDVALSFRLLRYVNSAFFGLRGEVRSIGQALALLGLENLRRWATLSVLASVDDKPTELTVTALARARFCELAGASPVAAKPTELFTLGLFSVIDAMLDAPMQDVVLSLPLAEDMREALVSQDGALGRLLGAVLSLESGEAERALAVTPRAADLYLEALAWADTAAASLFGDGDPATTARTTVVRPAAAPAPMLDHSPVADEVLAFIPAASTAPPSMRAAHAARSAATPPPASRQGFFARVFGKLFGRREQGARASA
jgi:EAL and modified HD-GYP domain-containing signal transduction protein